MEFHLNKLMQVKQVKKNCWGTKLTALGVIRWGVEKAEYGMRYDWLLEPTPKPKIPFKHATSRETFFWTITIRAHACSPSTSTLKKLEDFQILRLAPQLPIKGSFLVLSISLNFRALWLPSFYISCFKHAVRDPISIRYLFFCDFYFCIFSLPFEEYTA